MKIEVNKPEFVDIGLGCEMRKEHYQKIEKLNQKIANFQAEINKLKEQIKLELASDKKLADEGFCLINRKKVIKNALTGQTMKIELVHSENCISLKE